MIDANLILVWQPGAVDRSDWDGVAERIHTRAPDIRVHVARTVDRSLYDRPSLTVGLNDWRGPQPTRGPLYHGKHFGKWREYELFRDAGLPVPEAIMVDRRTKLEPRLWGERVIVKPVRGSQGRGITFERTASVGWRPGIDRHAQRFIPTGDPVTKYRVLTLFGRALFSILQTAPASFASGRFMPNIGGSDGDRWSDANDPDVIELAGRVFGVLPGVACLAVDILRDEHDGKLWVIEANPRGNSWHLSSNHGRRRQRAKGYNLYQQFDALSVAADALIEATRREAA